MKVLILILFFSLSLFASTLKSYNIYVRDDRVDVMLSFDSPFDNAVQQQKGDNYIKVILAGVTLNKEISEDVNNSFLSNMKILAFEDRSEIILTTSSEANIIASKTADGYGLRLRIKTNSMKNDDEDKLLNIKDEIQTTKDIDYMRYYIVVGVLFVFLMFLLIVKKIVEKSRLKARASSSIKEPNLSILYQKIVDDKNRLMLFEFEDAEYLMMVGNSNVLLNKKELKKKIKTKQEEFEELLKERGMDLNNANIKIRN